LNRMPVKATAISPANIAFIKYWGRKEGTEDKDVIPSNGSISMNIDNCYTVTTTEFSSRYKEDEIWIQFFGQNPQRVTGSQFERVIAHVNRFRQLNNCDLKIKVVSENSFPSDAGIAASASGFSALTMALAGAFKMKLKLKELSILTRLAGSGSACRSVIDGFVEWRVGYNSETSYAIQIAPPEFWDLADLVVVVKDEKKEFSSLHGHSVAHTSLFYKRRLELLKKRIPLVRKAINKKDLFLLGELIEEDAVELHLIAMSSKPPIFYWNEGTMEVIHFLRQIRKNGLLGYFTIDAGPNVHIICLQKDLEKIDKEVKRLKNVLFTIKNSPCVGTRLISKHLF